MEQQISNNFFNINEAMMVMMARNKTLSELVSLRKYSMAANIATTAWNLALIDNLPSTKSLKTQLIKMFSGHLKLNQKQTKALFGELIQLKYKFYPKTSHTIFHYTVDLSQDNNPILRIIASKEFAAEVIIDKIKTDLYPEKYAIHNAFKVDTCSLS